MREFVSDESLNAFIDGEFDTAESAALIARMRDDADLAERVATLRSLQSMVRVAYAEPPKTRNWRSRVTPNAGFAERCAFGCLLLALGVGGGWLLHERESRQQLKATPGYTLSTAPMQPLAGLETVSLMREPSPDKIMLHIDSAEPAKMETVLDRAERFLDRADREGRVVQLEIVANSHGLNLLREGTSPYADRIARMKQRHANLQFVACGQAIARLKGAGQRVELLPAAQTAPTAISEIITRLQQGWTYVRV